MAIPASTNVRDNLEDPLAGITLEDVLSEVSPSDPLAGFDWSLLDSVEIDQNPPQNPSPQEEPISEVDEIARVMAEEEAANGEQIDFSSLDPEVISRITAALETSKGGWIKDFKAFGSKGGITTGLGQDIGRLIMTPGTDPAVIDKLLKTKDAISKMEEEFNANSNLPGVLKATAEVAGGIWDSWKSALAEGAIGAGVGAAGGLAILPAAGTGHLWGQFRYWAQQGAGDVYSEMRKVGITDEIARKVSIPAGIVYGAVENIFRFVPGQKALMRPLKNFLTRKAAMASVKIAGRYIATVAGESVVEEPTQQVIQDMAYNIAADMMNEAAGTEIGKYTNDEVFQRALQAGIAAVGPAAILGGAGTIGDIQSQRDFKAKAKELELSAGLDETQAQQLFDQTAATDEKNSTQGSEYIKKLQGIVTAKEELANQEELDKIESQRAEIEKASAERKIKIDEIRSELSNNKDANIEELAKQYADLVGEDVEDAFPEGVTRTSLAETLNIKKSEASKPLIKIAEDAANEYLVKEEEWKKKLGIDPDKKLPEKYAKALRQEFLGKYGIENEPAARSAFVKSVRPKPLTADQLYKQDQEKKAAKASKSDKIPTSKNSSIGVIDLTQEQRPVPAGPLKEFTIQRQSGGPYTVKNEVDANGKQIPTILINPKNGKTIEVTIAPNKSGEQKMWAVSGKTDQSGNFVADNNSTRWAVSESMLQSYKPVGESTKIVPGTKIMLGDGAHEVITDGFYRDENGRPVVDVKRLSDGATVRRPLADVLLAVDPSVKNYGVRGSVDTLSLNENTVSGKELQDSVAAPETIDQENIQVRESAEGVIKDFEAATGLKVKDIDQASSAVLEIYAEQIEKIKANNPSTWQKMVAYRNELEAKGFSEKEIVAEIVNEAYAKAKNKWNAALQKKLGDAGDIRESKKVSSAAEKTVDRQIWMNSFVRTVARRLGATAEGSLITDGKTTAKLKNGMMLEFVSEKIKGAIGQNERIRDDNGKIIGWRIYLDPRDASATTVFHEGSAGHAAWDMLDGSEKAAIAKWLRRTGTWQKYEQDGRINKWWNDKWSGIEAADEIAARYISENVAIINRFSNRQTTLGRIFNKIKILLEAISGGRLFEGARDQDLIEQIASGEVINRKSGPVNNILSEDEFIFNKSVNKRNSASELIGYIARANPSWSNEKNAQYAESLYNNAWSIAESTRNEALRKIKELGAGEIANGIQEEINSIDKEKAINSRKMESNTTKIVQTSFDKGMEEWGVPDQAPNVTLIKDDEDGSLKMMVDMGPSDNMDGGASEDRVVNVLKSIGLNVSNGIIRASKGIVYTKNGSNINIEHVGVLPDKKILDADWTLEDIGTGRWVLMESGNKVRNWTAEDIVNMEKLAQYAMGDLYTGEQYDMLDRAKAKDSTDVRKMARTKTSFPETFQEWKTSLTDEHGTRFRETKAWKKFQRALAKTDMSATEFYPTWKKQQDFEDGVYNVSTQETEEIAKSIEKENPNDIFVDQSDSSAIGRLRRFKHSAKNFARGMVQNLPTTAHMISSKVGKIVSDRMTQSGNATAKVMNDAVEILKKNNFDKEIQAFGPDQKARLNMPGMKRPIDITKGQLLSIVRMTQNANGRAALAAGGFVGIKQPGSKFEFAYGKTDEERAALDARLLEWGNRVIATDGSIRRLNNLMSKVMDDGVYKSLSAAYKSITGRELPHEVAYIAIQRIGDLNIDATNLNQFATILTDWKALEKRVRSDKPILITDATKSMYSSLRKAARFVGYAENLRYLRGLLGSDLEDTSGEVSGKLADLIDSKLGEGTAKMFLKQIQSAEGMIDNQDFSVIRKIMQRQDVARLSGPSTVLKQAGALFMPLITLDFNTVMKGISSIGTKEFYEKVNNSKNGQMIKLRLEQGAAFDEFAEAQHNKSRLERKLEKFAFGPMRALDAWTVKKYVDIARVQVKTAKPNLTEDSQAFVDEVALEATKMLNDFQPAGYAEYRTLMHNSGLTGMLFNRYRTSVNAINATLYRRYLDIKRDPSPENRNKLYSAIAAPVLMQAAYFGFADLMIDTWRDWLTEMYGSDDDKKKARKEKKELDISDFMLNRTVMNVLQQAPQGASIASALQPMIERLTTNRQSKLGNVGMYTPTIDPATDFYKNLSILSNELTKMAEEEKAGLTTKQKRERHAASARRAIDASMAIGQYMPIGNVLPQLNRWLGISRMVESELR